MIPTNNTYNKQIQRKRLSHREPNLIDDDDDGDDDDAWCPAGRSAKEYMCKDIHAEVDTQCIALYRYMYIHYKLVYIYTIIHIQNDIAL